MRRYTYKRLFIIRLYCKSLEYYGRSDCLEVPELCVDVPKNLDNTNIEGTRAFSLKGHL